MIDRTSAPQTSLPAQLNLPPQEDFTTPKGIKLYSINALDSGVVRLTLVFQAGSRMQTLPYEALTAVAMLSEGTSSLDAAQIAERFDFYGIYYDTSVDRDFATITIACVSEFLDEALRLLGDMLSHPTFPERQIEIYTSKKRESMLLDSKKPGYIARRAFTETLFGANHPYGRFATEDRILDLTQEDLRRFYTQFLTRENLFAVCSGQIDQTVLSSIQNFTDSLPEGPEIEKPLCPLPEDKASTVEITRPESVQCSIRMGCLMPEKSHSDYVALQLLTTVFGGYFSSRLMQNIREERGYTYDVYAQMVNLSCAAYMAIGCEVGAEHRDDTIQQIKIEMRRLQNELIPLDELSMARNTIQGELMRLLDGPFGIADIAIENIQSDSPSDYINIFLSQISALTPEDLQDVARKYYDPERLTLVVVGPDREENLAQTSN